MRPRRPIVPGGTYFFTVALAERGSSLLIDKAYVLRQAVRDVRQRHPFEVVAWVTLPDHIHAVLTLPAGDAEFAMRWSQIKSSFTKVIASDATTRAAQGEAVWEKRFRERYIGDDRDLARYVDYVHFNPVKHGHVARPAEWPYSSMHRHVRLGTIDADWNPETARTR